VWREYAAVYPHLADRVRRFDPERAADCLLLYCVFLNNAYALLPTAERWRLPLVFTLYPGGGFELFHRPSDLMLSRLARSEHVRRIIVTQRATREYVLNSGFARPGQLELIWGLPTQGAPSPTAPPPPRRHWPAEKPTLDVCFAALKYMHGGADKGFDTFVASARRLAELDACFHFHVAGSFGPEDADLGALRQRITFHGTQPAHRLAQFFAGMDLIISPNVRFRLTPGGFDGFPTGTCTEAALNGVAVLCTDPFAENVDRRFVPDEDLCIVDADPEAIVKRVMALRADPDRLHRLARRGQERCREIYGVEGQLAPRLSVLTECMSHSRAAPAPS
jgi:glycosyltransferase involved in cell wall biosynthesis